MQHQETTRTLILMCDNRTIEGSLSDIISLTVYGNYKYAKRHNYSFRFVKPYLNEFSNYCCVSPITGAPRHPAWAKILAVHSALKDYDRVVYIDTDATFNTHEDLDSFLSKYSNPDKKVIFCTDYPYSADKPNTGFFVCYRNEQTFEFLRSWYCDLHNNPVFDRESPWEQATIWSWGLINQDLTKYYKVIPVNQFKMHDFVSGYSWQKLKKVEKDDVAGGRLIINHYFIKNPADVLEDLLKLSDMLDYQHVLTEVRDNVSHFKTENYNFTVMPKELTVIISGSYLDSHPSINFMQEVIESLELTGLPHNTPLILSHDKIKPGTEGFEEKEKTYQEYFNNLEEYIKTAPFKNITISLAPNWGHLTRTLKYAVSQVKTKYVFVLQHDIHIRREIPVLSMIDLMERNKHIKHLRFNVRKNLPTFMWWDGYKDGTRVFAEEEYDGVKVCVTPAWSDQNHLATKEYYESVVFPDCTNPDGELIYNFMENRMNGLCHHNHERYGTYIYGEYGAPRTSRHSDGRKSSPEPDED